MTVYQNKLQQFICGRGRIAVARGVGTTGAGAKQPSRRADRVQRLPARRQRLMDRIAPGDDQSQWRRTEPGPRETFAKNQFLHGIEVTTVLDRNCSNY